MKYEIPTSLDIKALPVVTQYHLQRLLEGKTVKQNLSRQKSNRLIKGNKQEAFEIGLALYTFTLISEFNEPLKSEEV
ncbi:hypothetical protein DDN72_17330 [Vibrio cholerae]|nr:hypothetical protein [Vibrio cholerae]